MLEWDENLTEENLFGHLNEESIGERPEFLYFIVAQEFERIKIGITRQSIKDRLRELQTGSCTPLTVLGFTQFQNARVIEQALHKVMEEVRVKFYGRNVGEWFHCHPLLMRFAYDFSTKLVNPSVVPVELIAGKGLKEFDLSQHSSFKQLYRMRDKSFADDYRLNFSQWTKRPISARTFRQFKEKFDAIKSKP